MRNIFEGIVDLGMIILGAPIVIDIMEPWVASGGTIESIPGIYAYEIAYWRIFPIFFGFALVIRVIVHIMKGPTGK